MDQFGASWEREIQYYRRECNELGARLLRMQEEQSAAHREARRSKTVAKLLREAYRLGDLTRSTQDLGMPMLELIVDHLLCDRAALLREEPSGSGQFLMSAAVGISEDGVDTVLDLRSPPDFLFTTEHSNIDPAGDRIIGVIGLPFVLWGYDRGSGLALVVANRLETNINRPFERGDEALIEGALAVYADLLYRKHVELQLRQAKQLAETSMLARKGLLHSMVNQVDEIFLHLDSACQRLRAQLPVTQADGPLGQEAWTVLDLVQGLRAAMRSALSQSGASVPEAALDFEWIGIDELVRTSLRQSYAASIRRGIEIECSLPNRRVAICADRRRIQQVIHDLIELASEDPVAIRTVRVIVTRRSDGGLDLIVGGGRLSPPNQPATGEGEAGVGSVGLEATRLAAARLVIERHGGTLVVESDFSLGDSARAVFPASSTRASEWAAL